MKNRILFLCSRLSILTLLFCAQQFAFGADAITEDLPFNVPFELGHASFLPGDAITIQELRGTTNVIAPGHTYLVTGTYTLNSRDEAVLAFYVTSRGPSGPSQIDARQVVQIKKGTGKFALLKTMREDGFPHLSFYPTSSGGDLGGVYFGQGESLLRNRGPEHSSHSASPAVHARGETPPALSALSWSYAEANAVLLDYLGDPVPPPANLDSAYTKDALIQAVHLAARQADITLKKVAVEDSEFPFLIGVLSSPGDSAKLKDQLRRMPPYMYGGGVGDDTCNTFNIIPWTAFPSDQNQRISHRLMLREQVFHHRLEMQPK